MSEYSLKRIEQTLLENAIDLTKLQIKCEKIKQKLVKSRQNDIEDITRMVQQFMADCKQKYLKPDDKLNTELTGTVNTALECYVLNQIHDVIVPVIYDAFKSEDELIFQKCLSLQNVKFVHTFGDVQLPASIVELASLDSHKTVHEKVSCITACHDFIFAELKFAMVELFAESCTETDYIPIVNNSDVVQLLVEVILHAKCKHLYSNLYFVQSLGDLHMTDKNCERVLLCFNEAIEVLTEINESQDLAGTFRKTCSEMDLKQYSSLVPKLDNPAFCNSFERLSLRRVTTQISKSHEYIVYKKYVGGDIYIRY